MSEYQYYEFLAIDNPLDERQRAELRVLSTRTRITATSFVNEYHWGDFRGNPDALMERYLRCLPLPRQLGNAPADGSGCRGACWTLAWPSAAAQGTPRRRGRPTAT